KLKKKKKKQLKRSYVWDETLSSVRGKMLQLLSACLALTTAMSMKDAVIGLILHLYQKGALRLVSLWLFSAIAIIVAVTLSGLIYRKFNRIKADLKRALESYRSWLLDEEEEKEKEKKENKQTRDAPMVEMARVPPTGDKDL
ncbi:hypothetical protein RFI_33360, partial [Reticulomyxa filosa]